MPWRMEEESTVKSTPSTRSCRNTPYEADEHKSSPNKASISHHRGLSELH
jgi:hypothetical protein